MSLRRFVGSVDWLRVVHVGATLARALREDRQLQADDATARGSAERLIGLGERIARESVGCNGTADCACVVCAERGTKR